MQTQRTVFPRSVLPSAGSPGLADAVTQALGALALVAVQRVSSPYPIPAEAVYLRLRCQNPVKGWFRMLAAPQLGALLASHALAVPTTDPLAIRSSRKALVKLSSVALAMCLHRDTTGLSLGHSFAIPCFAPHSHRDHYLRRMQRDGMLWFSVDGFPLAVSCRFSTSPTRL